MEIRPDRFKMNGLRGRLTSYALERHEADFANTLPPFNHTELIDEMAGYTLWTITHMPDTEKDETIFNLFYKKEEKIIKV